MATPSEKLAQSLAMLKAIQDEGKVAIQTSALTRTHRERLQKNGFIREVMKGWYIGARPNEAPGESTSWYTSYWGFVRDYLECRFAQSWCLSPEHSLALHTGNWTVPTQLIIRTPKGGNKPTGLLHNTSLFDLRLELPDASEIDVLEGLRMMSLPTALIACPPSYYRAQPLEIRTALSIINEPSDLLRQLLEGNHSTVAGRLAGAYRNIGRTKIAGTIVDTMRSAGHTIQEADPFEAPATLLFTQSETSPYVNRLRMLWSAFREPIIEHFPLPHSKPGDIATYLVRVDELYASDAYQSLSIEGYKVSADLIERVQQGDWSPDRIKSDHDLQNALAARGYWQAFQAVKKTIADVLQGKNAGKAIEDDYNVWYRELFGPSVVAGIIRASDLVGYRNQPVFIRQSKHTPPSSNAVRDLMPAFFDLLAAEEHSAVRIVLGHFMFVFIHPFMDGNGRIGRFIMNVMLAAGGYPWLIIPVDQRHHYMNALESASVDQDIVPFTRFLADLLNEQNE